jgi:2-succinyl-6-hydroxy-2,4-cyclohexadiene-1-carboxylate synthase
MEHFFVRRLRHLQHICQSFEGIIKKESQVVDIIRYLMEMLHPTPAVCGYPRKQSIEFIRRYEGRSFDRGLYSGPFGFLGSSNADIIVAIRSALLTRHLDYSSEDNNFLQSKISLYAGAGIVPGSTAQGEWSETGYKLGVLSSLFAQSPLTLKSFQTPNEAWATAFVEELIRSGVTQFYICPGSRSTPLTTALARAQRAHVGIIECVSTHDERGAAFRALGYARGARRPAAVVTSSGTAVANLYPAVIEAGMDGIPILLLTADRPYENRDTGANQAIDQIKVSPNLNEMIFIPV